MAERKIKYVANVVKWFDKVNGNTYHSVRITRCRDGKVLACSWRYGYGEQYKQTALEAMAEAKWLPVKYRTDSSTFIYEMEKKYPILWEVRQGLKREMVANGEA